MIGESVFKPLSKQEKRNKNGIDADEFYNIIHKLCESLNLLDYDTNNQNTSRFALLRAFPDEPYDQNNKITYQVLETKPFTAKGSMGRDTTYYSPRFNEQQYNEVSGNVEDTYAVAQESLLEIRCFSVSGETCNNLSKLIESIFITHESVLKRYIKDIRHTGTSGLQFIGRYDEKRLFTRALYFTLYTNKTFSLDLEQLKNIKLTID